MLERVLGIILPVFLVIALGFGFARRARPDMTWVNRINVNVLAPALIFTALAGKDFDLAANGLLIVGCVGVVLGSGLLAWPFTRLLGEDHRTFVPPMMFNNCGNMGLPLAALAFGQAGLSAMVAVFTISNLLHFTVGIWIVDRHAHVWKMLKSPMVAATFVGFAFAILHPPVPDWLMLALKLTGDAMIPLMLISLGVRLAEVSWSSWQLGVVGGLVCPLTGIAMAALLSPVLGLDPPQQGLLLLFGCLPPAVLNFMVAEQYHQEPGKVASIVLIGNLMAALIVPVGVSLALRP
jgi:predicted permease